MTKTWALSTLLTLGLALSGAPATADTERPDCTPCFEDLVRSFETRGWLGLSLHRDGLGESLEVLAVAEDGPAAATSLRPGDLIVSMGGRATAEVGSRENVEEMLAAIKVGQRVELIVLRGEQRLSLTVTAHSMPPDRLIRALGAHVLERGQEDRRVRFGAPPAREKPPGS